MPLKENDHTRGILHRDTQKSYSEMPTGKSWFLGIGINNYKHFNNLYNAVRDVEAIRQELEEHYDLTEVVSLFDQQATRRNIIRKLDELVRKVQEGDKLLIHYSGHGHLSTSGKGYWIPHDAELNYTDDYIANSRLRDYLEDIQARHILLVSDSCFSGSLFAQGTTRRLPEPEELLEKRISRYAFCSGRHDEEVADGIPGENSPFASSILEQLRNNQAPMLRISLLAEQVINRTASQYRQLPRHGTLFAVGDKGGQYIFRRKQQQLNDREELAWQACSSENTIEAYSTYLEQYPNGKYGHTAIQRIERCEQDDEAWNKAKQTDQISSYHTYIQQFPDGLYLKEAHSRIKKRRAIKAASRSRTFKSSDDMMLIEGGAFQMGSTEFDNEQPIHEVELSTFYMGIHPVTFEAYDNYCAAKNKPRPEDKGWGRAKRPVIFVSWFDAVAYCNWLSEQQGYQKVYTISANLVRANWNAKGYRLPTEAEWEYAAGGGKERKENNAGSNALEAIAWYKDNAEGKTQPVGTKQQNELGLYDINGNVWEWCWDWYSANYYSESPIINPKGPFKGTGRVRRGGSWSNVPAVLTSTVRDGIPPEYSLSVQGFRLCRTEA